MSVYGIAVRVEQAASCGDQSALTIRDERASFGYHGRGNAWCAENSFRRLSEAVAWTCRTFARISPAVEMPVDCHRLPILQGESRGDVAHPDIIHRRFDDLDIAA